MRAMRCQDYEGGKTVEGRSGGRVERSMGRNDDARRRQWAGEESAVVGGGRATHRACSGKTGTGAGAGGRCRALVVVGMGLRFLHAGGLRVWWWAGAQPPSGGRAGKGSASGGAPEKTKARTRKKRYSIDSHGRDAAQRCTYREGSSPDSC